MGDLRQCTDPTKLTPAECVPEEAAQLQSAAASYPLIDMPLPNMTGRLLKGATVGGGSSDVVRWENPRDVPGSFDSFGSVMLLLYVMSTADDWDNVMFHTMDVTSHGHAPERNDFSSASIFSVMWMFVGCFFSMNLFVGGAHARTTHTSALA